MYGAVVRGHYLGGVNAYQSPPAARTSSLRPATPSRRRFRGALGAVVREEFLGSF